jgi:2-C-methyl-D-erythritol 4-phosphate cytidylyltransferase/2-C-methyl-D-erythritol 2,4-cyclodiphosphate synthase
MTVTAVICAAGKGERAGFSKNKLLQLLDGKLVLERTIEAFDLPYISQLLVTSSEEDFEEISALCGKYARTKAVLGGNTRTMSVFNALKYATGDIVLVHDGARPFVKEETISGCIDSVKKYKSGICAVPSVDTVALIKDGMIESVPARDKAFSLQTPQGFYTKKLLAAYEKAMQSGERYTDDSSVYAAFVEPPHICAGARDNRKLTYAEDFERIARIGFGIDTHAFGKEQDFIVLAGVKIPSESGLIAHSDGDVLVHAVMDAMLSAAGLKDIGHYFPDSDEKWRGANSMEMLAQVKSLIAAEGFAVKNLSIAIQAERPRLAKYIDNMKTNLAAALSIPPSAIGISAGTNEGLGYIGEGKGITVHANVLLRDFDQS